MIEPGAEERIFTPSSTALPSPALTVPGTAATGQTVQGHCWGPTVRGTVVVAPMLTLSSTARTLTCTAPGAVGVHL